MTEDITFDNPRGQRLVGTLHRPASARPVAAAVVCHGMLSSRASPKHVALCEALAARAVVALRFDFAGRGDSDGRLEEISYHREVEDLSAAVALARGEAPAVALVGSSMGGAVSLLCAASDGAVAAVVALATVGRPGALMERLGGGAEAEASWEERGFVEVEGGLRLGLPLLRSAREVDVLAAASSLRCPLLVVHGAEDEVVPLAQAKEIHRRAPRSRLVVLPGADHVFSKPEDRERIVRLAAEFVAEEVARPRGGPGPP